MFNEADIGKAFWGLFGREVRPEGFKYWKDELESGRIDFDQMIKHFTITREFTSITEFSSDPDTFIEQVFELVLMRKPTLPELGFWGNFFEDPTAEIHQMLATLVRSEEFENSIPDDVTLVPNLDGDEVAFYYGVASGDPYANSVVLWTHAQMLDGTAGDVALTYEISKYEDFRMVEMTGSVTADADKDNTAKVIVDGLEAGTEYFYRFVGSDGSMSQTGRTKTLAEGDVETVNLAVFSCANFPAGFFNPYAEAATREYDAILHLGDYIYEYGAGEYGDDTATSPREPFPTVEVVTPEQYSERYKQYHSDADLQALRASAPVIGIWDDHETANDSWVTGAENHDPLTEGDWFTRRDDALEAYYNWMPIREPASGDLTEGYRSFDFGNLLSLHMLETRLVARDETRSDMISAILEKLGTYAAEPDFATLIADLTAVGAAILPEGTDPTSAETLALVAGDQALAVNLAATALLAEAADPGRELVGAEQIAWLAGEIGSSDAVWQVLGQQVLMNQMFIPAAILTDPTGAAVLDVADILGKQLQGIPLTAEEQATLDVTLPYNLDAWDGYVADREKVLALLEGKNTVVLAGDTHNAWNGDVTNLAGTKIGEIFATPGVSAPGLESYFAQFPPALVEQLFTGLVDGLDYAETSNRGYLDITFTDDSAVGEFVYVDTIGTRYYSTFSEMQTYTLDVA